MWLECIGVVSGCCCKAVYRFPHNKYYSSGSFLYIYSTCIIIIKNEKYFLNEQSRDAAVKKRANSSGLGKINNYCEDINIPPYNNTH